MSQTQTTSSRARVLIIEDQAEDCDRIVRLLSENGQSIYSITTATSLYTGLAKLHARRYDAILLDLSLPDSVGFRTLDLALREAPKVPIVAMTGLGDTKLAERAVKRGAYGYLCKKRDMHQNAVRRLVRQAIDRKKQADEKAITFKFLEIANSHHKLYPLLKQVSEVIQEFTECEAVRIRLLDNTGVLETMVSKGFGKEIMSCETCPAIRGAECVCQRVVQGDEKTASDSAVAGGSFFAEAAEGIVDRCSDFEKDDVRHACVNREFKSVAIVPIRRKEKCLGLCHVADSKPYALSVETVALLERLCCRLGDSIRRIQAEQALDEREQEVFAIFQSAPIMMAAVDSQLRLQSVNPPFIEFSPWNEADLAGQAVCYGLGCSLAVGSSHASGTPQTCAECPVPDIVQRTIESSEKIHRTPLALSVPRNPEGIKNVALRVTTTPLTVSHRKLALLYLERDYQNP